MPQDGLPFQGKSCVMFCRRTFSGTTLPPCSLSSPLFSLYYSLTKIHTPTLPLSLFLSSPLTVSVHPFESSMTYLYRQWIQTFKSFHPFHKLPVRSYQEVMHSGECFDLKKGITWQGKCSIIRREERLKGEWECVYHLGSNTERREEKRREGKRWQSRSR